MKLRINAHRRGKRDCEHSISHYKNVCKGASFSIQNLEKLEGDGFINGQQDFAVQKLLLQRWRLLDEENVHHMSLWSQYKSQNL